jgi:hypothetical protein
MAYHLGKLPIFDDFSQSRIQRFNRVYRVDCLFCFLLNKKTPLLHEMKTNPCLVVLPIIFVKALAPLLFIIDLKFSHKLRKLISIIDSFEINVKTDSKFNSF